MELLCLTWFVSILGATWFGGAKGHPIVGMLLGVFLGPIGLLVIAVANIPEQPPRRSGGPPPLPRRD